MLRQFILSFKRNSNGAGFFLSFFLSFGFSGFGDSEAVVLPGEAGK